MSFLTAKELKDKIDNNNSYQLIDIREDYEYEEFNIGGINIPLGNILSSINLFEKDKDIVFICNSGKRSAAIIHTLKRKNQLTNLFSITGVIKAYIENS